MGSPLSEWSRIRREVEYGKPQEARVEQGSREWHQLRRGRITGSVMAAAAGLNPYTSRGKVYDLLTQRKEPENLDHVPAVQHGNKYEDHAIAAYEAVTGDFGVQKTGIVLDAFDGYLAASPDGFCGAHDSYGRGSTYLEIKCPFGRSGDRIQLYDDIPTYYMPQVQGGLSVTWRKKAHFVSYVPGLTGDNPETGETNVVLRKEQIAIWEVDASEEYQAVLRGLLRDFYADFVVRHRRPPKLGSRPEMPAVSYRELYRGPVRGASIP